MSGIFFLDWAMLAVSLFNSILLLWLGLTVLLNAESRNWGIWLAGGGMLLGGVFFLSHSAVLGYGTNYLQLAAKFWWLFGWAPVMLLPYAWYLVTLWYAGFWEEAGESMRRWRRWRRVWLWLLSLVCAGMVAPFLFIRLLPVISLFVTLNLNVSLAVGGMVGIFLIYPFFILACIGFALDALLRPGPTARMMGDLARRRARPWLIAATFALLLVSLVVVAFLGWVVIDETEELEELVPKLGLVDLVVSGLIGTAVVLIGQGVVSYEVFTGRTLPRQGLRRYWRRALVLAVGYSGVVSLGLSLRAPPIYSLLLSTTLMVVFFALVTWRSYVERDHSVEELQPFVRGPQLYESLLSRSSGDDQFNAQDPLCALSERVLSARLAYLLPLGSAAPLFGPGLACPPGASLPEGGLDDLVKRLTQQDLCLPVEPVKAGGARWAVPLWNARGLCGLLLLGEKRDGGLYTEEEIELARAMGERLVDLQAGAGLARRLAALERRRLAESQLVDRRTRRVLHDQVLPALHAVLLELSTLPNQGGGAAAQTLADVHRQISDLLHDLPGATTPEWTRLGLAGALQALLSGELKDAFDQVDWQADPAALERSGRLPPLAAEAVFYAAREAMRNAARHARPADQERPLLLKVTLIQRDGLEVCVEDNGVGMGAAAPNPAGGGSGLALHSTLLAVMGGVLEIESSLGAYTRVRISLPETALGMDQAQNGLPG